LKIVVSKTADLTYWRESAPAKGQSQLFESCRFYDVNVFKLKTAPDFSSTQLKELAQCRGKSGGVCFAVDLQKELLQGLAYFSYSQMEQNQSVFCSYSLRVICQPSAYDTHSDIELYLIGRVASNSPSIVSIAQQEQAGFMASLLKSQPYQFEFDEDQQFEVYPEWLQNPESLSCHEVLKAEEMFPWIGVEGKYFYSPGQFQVNSANTMLSLFEQLQVYVASNQAVCIDFVLVPTRIEENEKKNIAKYIEALQQAVKGIKEDEISPDINALRAKTIYENIQRCYYSGTDFLYSFRVFSKESTYQSIASQLTACSIKTIAPQIVKVNDIRYALSTLKEVNINDKICVDRIWNKEAFSNLSSGPVTLKRLHRIVDLEEASAFFRLPIPMGNSYPGISVEDSIENLDAFTNELSQELDVEEIIQKYNYLITEDTYIVGLDQYGKPYTSDFTKIPHRIVAGTTGAGKTNFLLWMLYQFLYASQKINAKRSVYIADFKAGFDFYRIERRYDAVKLVTKAEDLAALLAEIWSEYERRLAMMIETDVESLKELRQKMNSEDHRIIIIIDEAASILNAERKCREEIGKYLQELSAKSRVTGIHIFYCSQRPTPEVIPRLISDNMDERLIFRVFPAASQLLLDDDLAAKLPAEPKGRAVYRGLDSELKVLATPYLPKKLWDLPFG
jgi:hypothetical protein